MKEMERAGLCIMKDDGTGYFDRFRGRIMFPLQDDDGNVVGFSGRILSGSKQEAKYLNSPETPIFEKSHILYNFHNARLNVRKTGKVILFEGFMDTISADRAGVTNSVAVMGTSLSDKHLMKLKRIAKEIIICCDGDDAGWEAAKRFADHGRSKKGWMLKSRCCPERWILMTTSQSMAVMHFAKKSLVIPIHSCHFIMAYAKRSKNLSYENDVLQYIHEVLEELAIRPSPVERDLYIRQLSTDTGVSVEAINQQFIKMAGHQAKNAKVEPKHGEAMRPQNTVSN